MSNQLIDFRMAKPQLATAFAQGYEDSKLSREQSRLSDLRAQTAEQNLVGGAQDIEMGGLKLSQLQEDRQAMIGLQDQLKAAGKDTNLDSYMDMLINTNRPEMVQQGLLGREKLRQQRLEEQRLNASANREQQNQAQINAIIGGGGAATQVSAPTNALAMPVAAPRDNMQNPPGSVNALNADFAGLRAGQDATEASLPLTPQASSGGDPRLAQIAQLRQLAAGGLKGANEAANQIQKQIEFEQSQRPKTTQTATQQNYELAVAQGFPGTFLDYQQAISPKGFENEYSKVVGKAVAERQVSQVQAAESAVDNILKINDTLTQLKDSDAITGFGAELFKNVERVKAQFLNDKAAGKKVTDTEVLDAMLGSDVFPMIQSLGIGARGLDTPNEREYLRSVMTGTITMNKDALIKLTEIRRNIAERAINKYNEKVDKGEFNKYFEAQGVAPKKIDMPGGASGRNLSPQDQAALDWAKSNHKDPRAVLIKLKLGM